MGGGAKAACTPIYEKGGTARRTLCNATRLRSRENVIVLFAQKSQVKDTPKIARSKIGKPELPLNVRSNSPFSPQTYT